MKRLHFAVSRSRGFTLLEVALIVAIIGMMMLIIVAYVMAPKQEGPRPPIEERGRKFIDTPKPKPVRATPNPTATPVPAATPGTAIELRPGPVSNP